MTLDRVANEKRIVAIREGEVWNEAVSATSMFGIVNWAWLSRDLCRSPLPPIELRCLALLVRASLRV